MKYIKTAESIGLLSPREYTQMEEKFLDKLLSPRYAEFIKIRNRVRKELALDNLKTNPDYMKQLHDKLITESGS